MKILSRDFSGKEKILILVLVLVLVGLIYYQFVDKPVRESLEKAASEKETLTVEYNAVSLRVAQLERMKNEIDDITESGVLKQMPSYNNSKNVNKLLNDVLGSMGYSIVFANVTRSGDLIRREIALQFSAPDYASVRSLLERLTQSDYRCLIGDLRCSVDDRYRRTAEEYRDEAAPLDVVASVTFYETVVGGEIDAGLPTATPAA